MPEDIWVVTDDGLELLGADLPGKYGCAIKIKRQGDPVNLP
jgi:hypothetical protein